uniref:thiamine pyrophosphate-dependent enzyme n=1 Tax=uncultured Sphingomonas sp. TaxID=158754 RepID=UPI0025F06FDE
VTGAERATFAARAVGYGMAGLRVDGNDALAVYAAVQWASERARSNNGPTLIEFFTYRAEGHSTSDDPTGYRPAGEAQQWPLGDPIARLRQHLVALGEWDDGRHDALVKEADGEVRAAQKEAEKLGILSEQGRTNIESMFDDVYAELPWHLAEQRDAALAERR